MKTVRIDIWSDIVCPWCFIGTRRLDAAIASAGDVRVELHHHPFVLQSDAPPEGENLQEMLRGRYGTDPRPMFGRVESAARESGIPLDLSRQPMTYNTLAAHTLLRHAEEKGTRHALNDALFAAYFLEGRNINDPDVLADIAARHGFAAEEAKRLIADEGELALTEEEVEAASRRRIRGVPLFILNSRDILQGAQSEETFRNAILRAAL